MRNKPLSSLEVFRKNLKDSLANKIVYQGSVGAALIGILTMLNVVNPNYRKLYIGEFLPQVANSLVVCSAYLAVKEIGGKLSYSARAFAVGSIIFVNVISPFALGLVSGNRISNYCENAEDKQECMVTKRRDYNQGFEVNNSMVSISYVGLFKLGQITAIYFNRGQ